MNLSKFRLRFFLILVLGTSVSGQDNNLAGHWIGTITRGDRSGTVALDLTPSAGKTAGILSDPSGQVMKIRNFKLDGNRLTFDAWAKEHGQPNELHFVGNVENSEIKLHSDTGGKSGRTIVFQRQNQ